MGESAVGKVKGGKKDRRQGVWCWFLLLQETCYSARLF